MSCSGGRPTPMEPPGYSLGSSHMSSCIIRARFLVLLPASYCLTATTWRTFAPVDCAGRTLSLRSGWQRGTAPASFPRGSVGAPNVGHTCSVPGERGRARGRMRGKCVDRSVLWRGRV
jgi:hypothetical protein